MSGFAVLAIGKLVLTFRGLRFFEPIISLEVALSNPISLAALWCVDFCSHLESESDLVDAGLNPRINRHISLF